MQRREIRKIAKLAINNIIYEGITDVSIFSRPFELELLKQEKLQNKILDEVVSEIDSILNSNGNLETLKINKIPYILVPKKTFYDFRKCALIDIVDEIKYLSIVLLIAKKIESKRVSKTIAFSYRYNPSENGRLFNKDYNYSSFKKEYRRLSSMKKYKIIVETDISNFYDRLNLHRLNSTLLSFDDIDNKISYIINELLLFWANRDSYGLPVGSNASRILAEALLIEIDNFLISNKIKFCRYVDDYRFFATNVNEANKILTKFVEILNKHGLSINIGKTKMRDITDYHNNSSIKKMINVNGVFEIIRGYSGLVPTKFRKLNANEIKKLQEENEDIIFKKLDMDSVINPEDIIKYIKIIIAKERYEKLITIPDILQKYPQFVPFFSDILFKFRDKINFEQYKIILNKFGNWLNDADTSEYILISIIRMFDSKNNDEKSILFDFFKNLKRNSGIYIARSVLEQLEYNLSRGELLELKDYYLRADSWEKRQIVNMVLNGLKYPENRPFIKDIKINCNDYFILHMVDNYEKKYKNKKY